MELTLSAISLFLTMLELFAWGQIAIFKHFSSFFMTELKNTPSFSVMLFQFLIFHMVIKID